MKNSNKPKPKKVKTKKTYAEAPSSTLPTTLMPKASSGTQSSRKQGLADKGDDVSHFLYLEGPSGSFERAFMPN